MPILHSVHYLLSEKGKHQPPLVLIHGAGGSVQSWPPQIRRLPNRVVYTIDLPGHGNSPGFAPQQLSEYSSFLLNWLKSIHIEQVDLCGHSMGGAIAMLMAMEAPETIHQLIIIGSAPKLKVNPQLLELASHPSTLPKAIEILVNWSFSQHASPSIIHQTMQHLNALRPSVLFNDLQACDIFDIQNLVSNIKCPTMLICGSEDKMTPPRTVKLFSQSIPNSQYIEIPQSGHMVTLEQPQTVADLITNFLT